MTLNQIQLNFESACYSAENMFKAGELTEKQLLTEITIAKCFYEQAVKVYMQEVYMDSVAAQNVKKA